MPMRHEARSAIRLDDKDKGGEGAKAAVIMMKLKERFAG
jgi:hypothetical protein